jgi:hypothetical protein
MKASTSASASSISFASFATDLAPLQACHIGVLLGKGGGDKGGDDTSTVLSRVRENIAHEVHPAALPTGMQHLGDRRIVPLQTGDEHGGQLTRYEPDN